MSDERNPNYLARRHRIAFSRGRLSAAMETLTASLKEMAKAARRATRYYESQSPEGRINGWQDDEAWEAEDNE